MTKNKKLSSIILHLSTLMCLRVYDPFHDDITLLFFETLNPQLHRKFYILIRNLMNSINFNISLKSKTVSINSIKF